MLKQVNQWQKSAQKISWMLAKEEYAMHDYDFSEHAGNECRRA
jgi:hypothetical protein